MNAIEQKIEKLKKELTRHRNIMAENWEEYFGEYLDLMELQEIEMMEELKRLRAEAEGS